MGVERTPACPDCLALFRELSRRNLPDGFLGRQGSRRAKPRASSRRLVYSWVKFPSVSWYTCLSPSGPRGGSSRLRDERVTESETGHVESSARPRSEGSREHVGNPRRPLGSRGRPCALVRIERDG